MTVMIGSLADATFRYLVTSLGARGIRGSIVDIGHLALTGNFRLPLDGTRGELEIDGTRIFVESPFVVRLIDLTSAASSDALWWRSRGTHLALARYLETLPWRQVVGFSSDQSNFSKVYQLLMAAPGPWSIPATCLTSDPEEAIDFLNESQDPQEGQGSVIYKGASASKTWATMVTPADMRRLELISDCPVLFQHFVRGFDVRVHVVDDRVFGERIGSMACDYRRDTEPKFEQLEVPDKVAHGCVALTRSMNLVMSGIDFKLTSDGEWFFLEANSMPCYQGYDRRAGGAISDAIARYLRALERGRET